MARLSNIKLHQQKKQAVAPEERTITPLKARFTPTTAEEALNVKSTEAVDPKSQFLGFERTGIVSAPGSKTREADLTNMNEETFLANQDKLNASGKEYWATQVKKDPTSVYAAVNEFLASSETPEEKRKRERREAVGEAINGLGNLIGNVANLYYAPRSGYSIDLNTMDDKRRERMERIQAKRDALDNQRQQMILNAKIGDVKAKADAAKDARDKAWKIKYDAYMKELDNAHKLGQIDAQTKAKYAEAVLKAKSQKDLEDYRQKNRESLAESNHQRIIEREEARGGGSRATIRIPRSDGNGYDEYRKNDLTNPTVVSQIYHSLPDEYKSTNAYESPTMFDMQAAIGKALKDGKITEIAPDIKVGGKSEKDNTAPHRKKGKGNSDNVPPYKKK